MRLSQLLMSGSLVTFGIGILAGTAAAEVKRTGEDCRTLASLKLEGVDLKIASAEHQTGEGTPQAMTRPTGGCVR